MTVLEAVLPVESSKAKLVLTRCRPLQPSPWPTAPEHPRTPPSRVLPVSTRRRSCCASLFLRTTISVWNTPRRSLPFKRSAWRSRCAPSPSLNPQCLLVTTPRPPPTHHPILAAPTPRRVPRLTCALVHVRQGAHEPRTTVGGPDFKSVHTKTFCLKTSTCRAGVSGCERMRTLVSVRHSCAACGHLRLRLSGPAAPHGYGCSC